MVWGLGVLGLPAQAEGQVVLYLSADTGSGVTRQDLPQTIHVYNASTVDTATGVVVTFSPPKGVRLSGNCLVEHLKGGLRSYTCLVGTIGPLQTADVTFSISMGKPGDASFYADVACDQGATAGIWLWITIS